MFNLTKSIKDDLKYNEKLNLNISCNRPYRLTKPKSKQTPHRNERSDNDFK